MAQKTAARKALDLIPDDIGDAVAQAGPSVAPGRTCGCGRRDDVPTTLHLSTIHECGHASLAVVAGDSDVLLTLLGCWVRTQIEAGRDVAGLLAPDADYYEVLMRHDSWEQGTVHLAAHATREAALRYARSLLEACKTYFERREDARIHDDDRTESEQEDDDKAAGVLKRLLPDSMHDDLDDYDDPAEFGWDKIIVRRRRRDPTTGVDRAALDADGKRLPRESFDAWAGWTGTAVRQEEDED